MGSVSEGWAKPIHARKFHYFRPGLGRMCLCGSWPNGTIPKGVELVPDNGRHNQTQCTTCLLILNKHKKEKPDVRDEEE